MEQLKSEPTNSQDLRQLFNVASQVQTINLAKDELRSNKQKVISDVTGVNMDELLTRARELGYSAENVKSITPAHLDTIFDGIELETELPADREAEFRKGIIDYFLRTDEIEKELDAELGNLDKYLKDQAIELDAIVASFDDVDAMLYSSLDLYEKEAQTQAQLDHVKDIRDVLTNAQTLDNIYLDLKRFGHKNILNDYYNNGNAVYDRFKKFAKRVDIQQPERILSYENFEEKFMDARHHGRPNLLLFIVIRNLAYARNTATKKTHGVFLARLLINLKALYNGTLSDAKREELIAGADKILDLFNPRTETKE